MYLKICAGIALLLASDAPAAAQTLEGPRVALLVGLDRTDAAPGAGASDGFFYGGQLGYDVAAGAFILGVEADASGSTASGRVGAVRSEQGLFATAAARVGVPVGDRLLPFVRGGYAYHEVDRDGAGNLSSGGYTVGAGLEYGVGERLFLRGEYRFSDYGDRLRGQQFLAGAGLRF